MNSANNKSDVKKVFEVEARLIIKTRSQIEAGSEDEALKKMEQGVKNMDIVLDISNPSCDYVFEYGIYKGE